MATHEITTATPLPRLLGCDHYRPSEGGTAGLFWLSAADGGTIHIGNDDGPGAQHVAVIPGPLPEDHTGPTVYRLGAGYVLLHEPIGECLGPVHSCNIARTTKPAPVAVRPVARRHLLVEADTEAPIVINGRPVRQVVVQERTRPAWNARAALYRDQTTGRYLVAHHEQPAPYELVGAVRGVVFDVTQEIITGGMRP